MAYRVMNLIDRLEKWTSASNNGIWRGIRQFRQCQQLPHFVVADAGLRAVVPSEMELLEILESGEGFERFGSVLVRSTWIPDRAWEVELAQG